MINRIKFRFHHLRLRWQLFLILMISGTASLFLFQTLWKERYPACFLLSDIPFLNLPAPSSTLWMELSDAAAMYEFPDSEDDKERTEKLQPFLAIADKYTSIYIYGITDGLYRAGRHAAIMDDTSFRPFFDLGYQITGGDGEQTYQIPMKFKNGYANVLVYFYHYSCFIYPYFYFCMALSILIFLTAILAFISRKMKRIMLLEKEILRMSCGDLEHAVPVCGYDEIGTLARELDHMRQTLSANIRQEQESRRANQDLITALSHDLRTPLTVLGGYLEVLKLKRNPAMQEKYLERCLKKIAEIREMTDRMFEYALVYEETESVSLTSLSIAFVQQCLAENVDYIRLIGFLVDFAQQAFPPYGIQGDKAMLRRIFSNVFSNIIKYGDKQTPVQIEIIVEEDECIVVTLSNTIRQEYRRTESNHIGLKSIRKMIELMGGNFTFQNDENNFKVYLSFIISTKKFPGSVT